MRELSADESPAWDAYVRGAPTGLPLHLSGWRQVLQRTYQYPTRYLLASRGADIVGVMPLFLVRSRLLGNTATTMPGGFCAQDQEAAGALIDSAVDSAREWGAARLRLHDTRQQWPAPMTSSMLHEHWLLDLSMGSEPLWRALDGNLRRQVRKAKKNGLHAEVDGSGVLLEPFYQVFSRFTHDAGTPVFSRQFLENIVREFPGGFNIVVVYAEQLPIGGYFQLEMGDTVYGMWGAALRDHFTKRPVHLAMWEIMRDACERGYTCLDMGRSPVNSNASHFKGQWGGIRAPVYQQVRPLKNRPQSDAVSSGIDENRNYQLFMRLWPKLPLSMTRQLGPQIRRHLPFA